MIFICELDAQDKRSQILRKIINTVKICSLWSKYTLHKCLRFYTYDMAYIFEFDICNSKFKYSRGYQCLTTRGRDGYLLWRCRKLCISCADSWSKNVLSGQFSVHFRWNFHFFLEIFIAFKDSSLDFRAIVLS